MSQNVGGTANPVEDWSPLIRRLPDADRAALEAAIPAEVRDRSRKSSVRGRDWLVHRLLVAADVIGLTVAFLATQNLYQHNANDLVSPEFKILAFVLALPLWVVAAHWSGLYERDEFRADHSTADDFVRVLAVVTIGTWLFYAGAWLTNAISSDPPRRIAFWALAIALVVSLRALARGIARRHPLFRQNALIVGAGEVGQLVARKIMQHPEYGITVVGFVDIRPKERRPDLGDLTILGLPSQVPELVALLEVDRVIIAFSDETHEELLELIRELRAVSIHIDVVPRLFEAVGPKVEVHSVEALPLLGLPACRLSPSDRLIKRWIDILIAGTTLLLTSPLFAFIALRIKLDSKGPVFFRQTRLGLNMREFTALKFRTMRNDADDSAHREYIKQTMSSRSPVGDNGIYKLDRPDAITPFGRWLRKTSLDELPQLINVVRGEMSLVGPRPCIPYETEHFAPHHYERFLVPAGMTGLWQVTARARSSFGEALDMDVSYARGWTLGLDLRLLCRTPIAMLRQAATA